MPEAVEPVRPVLEPAAAAFAEATANPPYLFDLPPAEAARRWTTCSPARSPSRPSTRSG
ncbi:hypothetical protein ACFQ3Z_03720 [Streptomyces nogalater]